MRCVVIVLIFILIYLKELLNINMHRIFAFEQELSLNSLDVRVKDDNNST